MKPIQLVLLALVLFALVKVIRRARRRGTGTFDLAFWIVLWLAAAFMALFPDSTSVLAELLGIRRGADLVVYLALVVAFYLIFRVHLALEGIEQSITEMVRALALERVPPERQRDAGQVS